ncbi:S24/S26 family peptidase [Amnibacterium kyonggiense]|uniref:Signal peptidase I n=1 Tax=Amnibacterium kyonggiense TaxID=595671 RepID=A0A4V3EB60_9MICO|nr:S24/S26 family peptidase [Amnibacterium kyonggiense]TDS79744.1 signal peptidase I [Amnibacterium kyonggiense]
MDAEQLTLLPGRTVWTLRDEPVPTGGEARTEAPADHALRHFSVPGILGPEDDPGWAVHADDLVAELRVEDAGSPSTAVRPRSGRPALVVATVVLLLLCATVGAGLLAGYRGFVVETPSMGTAAPVGTLVVTAPITTAPQRGDVIAFIAPGVRRVYTHRVSAVDAAGGIRTKGDINAAADPWTIERSAVLGRAVAIVPGVGFVLRAVPLLLVGGLLLTLLTLPIRRRDVRAASRVIGWHLIGTAVLLHLQPLVHVVVIASEAAADGARASIVSTGLLPIRLVTASGDVLARLADGVPGTVALPTGGSTRIVAVPDLAPGAQLLLIGLAVLPSLVVLLVGLPRRERVAA